MIEPPGAARGHRAARYQLMEDAAQNAERLIDELTLEMRQAGRQAITQEMQQLVAGAGLLGRDRSPDFVFRSVPTGRKTTS